MISADSGVVNVAAVADAAAAAEDVEDVDAVDALFDDADDVLLEAPPLPPPLLNAANPVNVSSKCSATATSTVASASRNSRIKPAV